MSRALRDRWLACVNLAVAVFAGLPFVAPLLLATGWPSAANAIYAAYRGVCHQWPFRSYFLLGPQGTYGADQLRARVGADEVFTFVGNAELGYKVAFCERDVAIYLAVLLGGIFYALHRSRVRPLGLIGYALLIAPMALDGFTQLFGWRESTVELRTLTGALFGLASVWLLYPRVDRILARQTARRAGRAGRIAESRPAAGLPSASGP